MAAPLNVFQRLIRQWESLHPYNAAQWMRLRGRQDANRCSNAWRATIHDLGLDLEPGKVQPLADCCLEKHITAELNRPFDPSGRAPFRPFILHRNDDCCIGVVYQHWVADSASIRLLMREWFVRIHDPQRARRSPLPVARVGYWNRFGPFQSDWRLLEAALGSVSWSSKLKRARRVEGDSFARPTTSFTLHRLPAGIVPPLVGAARRCGVTLNDLMLAAIAQVCDRHVAAGATAKRHDLALGTIVDLRAARLAAREEFGLFLGFTDVLCRYRDVPRWPDLLRSIATQNAHRKRSRAAEASMVRMFGGVVAGGILGQRTLLNWYRKRLPLCAGISNVNLNRSWVAAHHPDPIVEYARVSPVGPIMPIVFTPSTLGDDMHFGLTCRDAVVSPARAPIVAAEFARILTAAAAGTI